MKTSQTKWQAYEEQNPIVVSEMLLDPHPITRRAAEKLGVAIAPLPGGNPPEERIFNVSVSGHNADLALRIVDAFVQACEARGFGLRHDPDNSRHYGLSVFIDGAPVPLGLYERGSFVTHLSLELGRHYSLNVPKKVWKDHPRRPLSGKLNTVMLFLRAVVANRIAECVRREEADRRMKALHREREELRESIKQERRAIEMLHGEADDWRRAATIRAYVAAVEAQSASRQERKKRAAWSAWARAQADRLDPLTSSPSSILDTPIDHYRELTFWECLEDDGSVVAY